MQPFEIQALVATLPPGAKLHVLTVEMPTGESVTATHIEDPSGIPAPVRGWMEHSTAVVTPVGYRRAATLRGSIEERLDAVRSDHGADAALKPREWRHLVGLTEREIERAILHGALPASPKGDGRDHAAKVVSVAAMTAYLATVDAVERGDLGPPGWWEDVRRERRWRRPRPHQREAPREE